MDQINKSFGFQLNFTTRNMRRYSNDALKRANLDITVDHWGILRILEENNGQLNASQLSSTMLKDKPTVTRMIDVIVKKKLVERIPDPNDRRATIIQLTKAGYARAKSARSVVSKVRTDMSQQLTERDFKDLERILTRINSAIDLSNSH